MRKLLGTVLTIAIISMLFFVTPCQASPDEYLVWYHEQYNADGTSMMMIWLYRMTEVEPNYDFYIIKIRIIGMVSSDLHYVEAQIFSNGVCNDHEPESGTYLSDVSLSISVDGLGFGINAPAETVATSEELMLDFAWKVRTLLGVKPDKEFVSSWYVPDGVNFAFLVIGSEWYEPLAGDPVCLDAIWVYYPYEFPFRTLTVETSSYGTTSPKPRTYNYHPNGFTASVWARPYQGHTFRYWMLDGTTKRYGSPAKFTMDNDHSIKAYFGSPDGTSGCPTLFVWNGADYAEEGILDIHAESDVIVEHEMENSLASTMDDEIYKLQLRELDNFTSHIDQVKLLAVYDSGETEECPLINAMHSEDGNVLSELLQSDDIRIDTEPNESIGLKFQAPTEESEIIDFIFVIEGYNPKPLAEAW